jgi:hypothetical protein
VPPALTPAQPEALPAPDVVPELVPAAASTDDAGASAPHGEVRRRRPTPVALALVLVVVLLVATLLVGYLVRTTRAWQATSSDWEDLARRHGADLATTQTSLDEALTALEETQAQLATAQARITELADEKAQLGDASESQRQLADYQARVSAAAGTVATALTTCVDGQQRLIGYLKDAASYDATDLARFEDDVERVCASAKEANTALQQELDK